MNKFSKYRIKDVYVDLLDICIGNPTEYPKLIEYKEFMDVLEKNDVSNDTNYFVKM